MSDLEHLVENTLILMDKKEMSPYDIKKVIKDDPNFEGVDISVDDIWTICQYVMYTWCAYCHKKEDVKEEEK